MKATFRNGKGSARHNDRSYIGATEAEREEVILTSKAKPKYATFEQCEVACYEELYRDWLDRQNDKYRKKGNYDRIKTMDQIVGGPNATKTKGRYEPTETILQIGKNGEEVSLEVLKSCISQYMREIKKKYGSNMQFLDLAIHKEKSSVYHAHLRRTWFYTDEEGVVCPGKKEALKQLGIVVDKADRFNNATVLQTAEERELWYSILKAHGLEIDEVADLDNAEHQQPKDFKRRAEARNKAEKEQEKRIKDNNKTLEQQKSRIIKNNHHIHEQEIKIEEVDNKAKDLGIASNSREVSLDELIEMGRF